MRYQGLVMRIIPDVHRLARYGSSDLAEYTVLTLFVTMIHVLYVILSI